MRPFLKAILQKNKATAPASVPVITIVQSGTYLSQVDSNTHTVNLYKTSTSGDILILGATSNADILTPSGWTLINNANGNAACKLYYKVSDGTETSATVTLAASASDCCVLCYTEVKNITTPDQNIGSGALGAGTTIGPMSTPTTTSKPELVIMYVSIDIASAGFFKSWSQDFKTLGGGNNSIHETNAVSGFMGYKIANTIYAQSGAMVMTVAGDGLNSAIIATFK